MNIVCVCAYRQYDEVSKIKNDRVCVCVCLLQEGRMLVEGPKLRSDVPILPPIVTTGSSRPETQPVSTCMGYSTIYSWLCIPLDYELVPACTVLMSFSSHTHTFTDE